MSPQTERMARMFNQLLESKPQKKRSPGSAIFSVVFHSALIGLGVWATANAAVEVAKPKQEKITFVDVKRDEPPPPPKELPPAPPRDVAVAPPPPKGFQVLTAPVNVPTVIPDVDLSRRVTNEADFSGKGVAGGSAKGVVGGTGVVPTDNTTYFEFQVEKVAARDPNSPTPSYPEPLRNAGVTGEVQAEFVVDTTGRAEAGTLKIRNSTNDLFTASVRAALPRMRFIPAEVGGRKVRQLVSQSFSFAIH